MTVSDIIPQDRKKSKPSHPASNQDFLTTYMHNDFIDIDSSMLSEKEKALTNIHGKQWLNSDHMSHVNKLMVDAGFSINGLQDTLLAPTLQKSGKWQIPANGFNSQKPPSVNIHYNSQKHWVTSFQYENGDIYLIDSNTGGILKTV